MPLTATHTEMMLSQTSPSHVALSMEVDGSKPADLITVIITRECLDALDPLGSLGKRDLLEIARGDRMRIESAASTKFDREGMVGVTKTITLGTHDLP